MLCSWSLFHVGIQLKHEIKFRLIFKKRKINCDFTILINEKWNITTLNIIIHILNIDVYYNWWSCWANNTLLRLSIKVIPFTLSLYYLLWSSLDFIRYHEIESWSIIHGAKICRGIACSSNISEVRVVKQIIIHYVKN